MKVLFSIATLVLAAAFSIGVTGASENGWHMTAASTVQAVRTKSGISIDANVELANACYEASITAYPSGVVPAEYQVVTRVKPKDVGRLCAMVIVPGLAQGSFIMDKVPNTVTVHATNKTFTVPVETSRSKFS